MSASGFDVLDLAAFLLEAGVPAEEVARAEADQTLPLLALEHVVSAGGGLYTIDEVAALGEVEPDVVRSYWRALGFADPPSDARVFSDDDLDMVRQVAAFVNDEMLDRDLVLQMTRVIGAAMERVASAQVDAIAAPGPESDEERRENDLASVRRGADLLPMMPGVIEYVWRRHLAAVARRRRLRLAARDVEDRVCVGFADLVGFTSQTQSLSEHELAEVVRRFEELAYDTITAHRGRVVKLIGDAVMFMADTIEDGAVIALALADSYAADDALSDVRVGLAAGPVLEREGDVYGSVVNLASRIVAVAYPGAVVVSTEVQDALEGDERFVFRSIRQHYLKDIGRVPLWAMRHAGDEGYERYRRARERRAARRDFMLQRRAERLVGGDLPRVDGEADEMPAAPRVVVTGDEPTGELEALTDAVLAADIAEDLQVEMLADIEASRRLAQLEREAQEKAQEADLEAEGKLERIEAEARRKVEEIEAEAHRRIEEALRQAEEQAVRANEEASRKVKRVAEEAERKAEQAERDARKAAKRKAARNRRKK